MNHDVLPTFPSSDKRQDQQQEKGKGKEKGKEKGIPLISSGQSLFLLVFMLIQGLSGAAFLLHFPLFVVFILSSLSPVGATALFLSILHRHWLLQQQSERTFLTSQMIWIQQAIREGYQEQRQHKEEIIDTLSAQYVAAKLRNHEMYQYLVAIEQLLKENIELTRIRRQRRRSDDSSLEGSHVSFTLVSNESQWEKVE